MFSFLWSYFSQPPPLEDDQPPPLEDDQPPPLEDVQPPPLEDDQPPPLEDDQPPPLDVYPSHTGSDPYCYELPRPDLYPGPIDVAPTDMPELFDILLSDVDDKVLHNEISTALGSAYLSETPHLTSPHTTVDGVIFGTHSRVLFPLVVRLL